VDRQEKKSAADDQLLIMELTVLAAFLALSTKYGALRKWVAKSRAKPSTATTEVKTLSLLLEIADPVVARMISSSRRLCLLLLTL
jgi:hypothetical protein